MERPLLPQSAHQELVGQRLRQLIDRLDITYVEAATIMGVSKQVLRNWMAGDNYPSAYAIYRLCRVKAVTFDFLFLGDWSQLPFRLAKQFEEEVVSNLGASDAEDLADVGAEGGT